jgi:MGT family glycosyltransferase
VTRYLFVTWDGGGNVNPVLALTSRLTGRGHAVGVLGPPSVAVRVEGAGGAFVPRTPGATWDLDAIADDVTAAVASAGPDVLVVDHMLPSALCAAEATGRPSAALVHTLYGANVRDGELVVMGMAASVDGVNAVRERLGLPAVDRLRDVLGRAGPVLVLCPAELDAPPVEGASYVGPVLEDAGPDAGWAPPVGEEPLVAVSLGTTPMDEAPVLQRVLDASAGLPVRVVATVGGHLDPASFPAPPNASVVPCVRHAAVLPHAGALVTHAGLGSVLAALAHGVPMVCLPLGREQPANATAVARVGAGHVLEPDAAPDVVRDAIAAVLAGPRPAPIDGSGARAVAALEGLANC